MRKVKSHWLTLMMATLFFAACGGDEGTNEASSVPSSNTQDRRRPSGSEVDAIGPMDARQGPVGPTLDRTIVTTTAAQTKFLYTGGSPIQTGVAAGAIETTRASGLSGTVIDRDSGNPLAGVAVSVFRHPEWGTTTTAQDGSFYLAVNGGGPVVLDYRRAGYLPGRRAMTLRPLQYAGMADLAMVAQGTGALTESKSAIAVGLGESQRAAIAPSSRVYQGPVTTDASGSRQIRVFFPSSVRAIATADKAGPTALDAVTVHATEYTVGPNGPKAMPAELPPTSAYTFAAELSVEGSPHTEFDPPLPVYVNNFLSVPVGTQVPSGYYDWDIGQWVASANGRVLKLLSVTAGKADLDVSGSGTPATPAVLTSLGITDEERTQLATSYAVGASFWRVPVAHFSTFDFNFGLIPPEGALAGNPGDNAQSPPDNLCEQAGGSTIECETQVLRESVGVAGTPFTLEYRSDRVVGRKDNFTLNLQVTPPTAPGPLQGAIVEITIAGRTFEQEFDATLNRRMSFTWDGKDAFGRMLQGLQPVKVRLANVYNAVYGNAPRFGAPSDGTSIGIQTRIPAPLWGTRYYTLGTWDAQAQGLGGWDLDVHHAYDPVGKVVNLGSGTVESAKALSNVVDRIAGIGQTGQSPDGTAALSAKLSFVRDIAVGPDRLVYYADTGCIRRITTAGTLETYAGLCGSAGDTGDGGPAASARIDVKSIAFGEDGALYFTSANFHKIRKIAPVTTIVSKLAGIGTSGFSGDGGLATLATLNGPTGISVGPDGAVYFADRGNNRVRRIGRDGFIQTIAGNGKNVFPAGDGGPATNADIGGVSSVAAAAEGTVLIGAGRLVRAVGADGIIRPFAGKLSATLRGDGGPAVDASLRTVLDLALGDDGSVYLTDTSNTIRRVDPYGVITTAAGVPDRSAYSGDGGPAAAAQFSFGGTDAGLAISHDDVLYVTDGANYRIRRVQGPLPGVGISDVAIASRDGGEVYVFDGDGRHLRTQSTLVNAPRPLYAFAYDTTTKLLTTITDLHNNVTTIQRDGSGKVTGIQGPFGQVTQIGIGTDGYIATISNPASESVNFTYYAGGLLKTRIDPRGQLSNYSYDAVGRLLKDEDPPAAGGYQALARTDQADGWTVTKSSKLGRTTTYRIQQLPTRDRKRTTTFPNGLVGSVIEGQDGVYTTNTPDGMVYKATRTPDPRFGMLSPVVSTTTTTPAGLTRTSTVTRTAVLSNPTDLLSLVSLTETQTVNGRTARTAFDAATRTVTTTSPAGRKVTTILDTNGRPQSSQIDGLNAVTYGYDTRGRPTTVSAGTRSTVFGYHPTTGRLDSITNSLTQTVQFQRDLAGRATQVTFPDTKFTLLGYDANSNVSSVTPPGKPAHTMTFSPVNLLGTYTAPAISGVSSTQTVNTYDPDRALTNNALPGGLSVQVGYDTAGRTSTLTYGTTTVTYGYSPTTGNLTSVTSTAGENLAFGYDGVIPTSATWSGAVAGSLSRTYDASYRMTTESVNGSPISFAYDADGIITSVGNLTITPDVKTGFTTATSLANTTEAYGYDLYGAYSSYAAKFNAANLLSLTYTRDGLGRIQTKTETVSTAAADGYEYTYDLRGRLTDVKKNGTLQSHYTYDDNGNRLSGPTAAQTATYDAQDRLKTYGTKVYSYTDAGDLRTKQDGSATTTYTYDAVGSLARVALPAKTLDYVIDGAGRRVGKKVNGTLTQGFLYRTGLQITAELDGSNNLVSRFVYGARANVPSYMVKGGTTYRLVSDPLGSVRMVVDATTGTVAQKIDYDEFGRITSDTSPGFQPFGFAGGLYDPDTGLTRFGARDYDAETGRWTTKDPSGFAGGQNFYEYAGNDPVNYIDPDGHLAFLIPIAIGMAEGALMGASLELVNQALTTGCLDWGAVGNAALLGGALGGLGRVLGGGAGDLCFAAGTLVQTCEDGQQPIETLHEGDEVLSWNARSGVTECHRVVRTFERTATDVAEVSFSSEAGSESIAATLDHPFWIESKGWTPVRDIVPGDRAWSRNQQQNIKVVDRSAALSERQVYNIEVADAHSYFVGTAQLLVHNTCAAAAARQTAERGLADLAQFRSELGLAEGEGVLSRLDVGNQRFYGINGHGQAYARPASVNFQSLRHAEGDAFSQAARQGAGGGRATLFVDREPCGFCSTSLRGYMRNLDLDGLTVWFPGGGYSLLP